MMDRKPLITRLKYGMADCNMNQKMLAASSGVSASSLSRIMNGQRVPDIEEILLLATAMDVCPIYLQYGKQQNL